MIHLGDITKIDWSEVPTVDVVTGGSPCQGLSIAGKRKGLADERSGLFMEQIRCVKELRAKDERAGRTGEYVRPRIMVWENVPGAFSSGSPKGSDFAAVLEEIVKIVEPEAPAVSVPDKGWPSAGCLYDELGRWSVAFRVHNAEFWGVPQRRKRIALVADFGGKSAPEILFERNGMSWNPESSGEAREGAAGEVEGGVGNAVSFQERAGKPGGGKGILIQNERTGALSTLNNQSVCYNIGSYHSNAWKSDNPHSGVYETETSKTLDALNCGAPTCNQGGTAVVETYAASGFGGYAEGTGTQRASGGDFGGGSEMVVCVGNGQLNQISMAEQANTLDTMHDQQAIMCGSVVRRLTPLECERLQGYPDGWTDIGDWVDSKGKQRKCSDAARYKALGNSIALPFWKVLARRIAAQYDRDITIGSLFDGIGGFPLAFEHCGAKAVWASEIDEFPMAVTKVRF